MQRKSKKIKPIKSSDEIKIEKDDSRNVIITGDNNTVNLGGRDTKSDTPKRNSRKTTRKKIPTIVVVTYITLIGTIIAALLGSPIIYRLLFTPESTPTVTFLASTVASSSQIATVESVTPTETPTPTFILTAISTSTLVSTSTPLLQNTLMPTPVVLLERNIPMVLIPSGFFQMQSEKGLVKVFLNNFYIDQYEVTNSQYRECVVAGVCIKPYANADPEYTNVIHFGDHNYDNFPVILVSWFMADSYCKWRSDNTRLPTDEEWEKAARGSLVGQDYPWGNELPVCIEGYSNGANFSKCASIDAFPVKQYAPNGYGLYDMAGNVREWVNNSIPNSSDQQYIRGGSWISNAARITVYIKSIGKSSDGYVDTGFRCARDVNP